MDRQATERAMNEGYRRLWREIGPQDGSWPRLIAHATARTWAGEELVALLSVAYEIGHTDGESEAEMYAAED